MSAHLLLLRALDLVHLLHDLPKHHHAVAVQESDAGETLAVLERVDHQRLLRGEVHLANDFKPFETLGTTAENHTFVSPAIRAWLVSVWDDHSQGKEAEKARKILAAKCSLNPEDVHVILA